MAAGLGQVFVAVVQFAADPGLQRLDHRRHRPSRRQILDLLGQAGDSRSGSVTATATVALWTSKPTKMISFIRSVPHV